MQLHYEQKDSPDPNKHNKGHKQKHQCIWAPTQKRGCHHKIMVIDSRRVYVMNIVINLYALRMRRLKLIKSKPVKQTWKRS